MKRRVCFKILAVLLSLVTAVGAVTFVGAESSLCFHSTVRTLVENESGYAIVNRCTECGIDVTEVGDVDSSTAINMYKTSDHAEAYTLDELVTGFASANGNGLHVSDGVISTGGSPYWFVFDLKVNGLPVIAVGDAQADLSNTDSRAYKGWSVICMVNGSFDSPLRLIADGWEADSGATGTIKGTTDGYASIHFANGSNAYRDNDTVVKVKTGDSLNFAMRIDPATGIYDVYVDNLFAGSGTMPVRSADSSPFIRLWEGDAKTRGGLLDFTNISLFEDNYTEAVHIHEYTEIIEFHDEGLYRYETCECGYRASLESENITAAVADGLDNIYDGYGTFAANADNYWFVTDMNIRGEAGDGALIKFGSDTVLEIKDGKLVSGVSTLGAITYPTTYQVAVEISDGTYKLYVNGRYAVNGTLADTADITCGSKDFGYHVRFLYNKAVTLGETSMPVIPQYRIDKSVKICYHSDSGMSVNGKTLVHTDSGVKYIYNCSLCGERVYSMLKKDLTNPANDTEYKYKTGALMRSELDGFSTEKPRYLYLENNVISDTARPYWLTFDVTPTEIPSNDTGNLGDPNSRVYKGYGLVSTEAAFLPITELRVIPDGWEEGNASGMTKGATDGKAEVKIIKISEEAHIGMDSLGYRHTETVAYLESGKTTSFALRIDPQTGIYDVYVDGLYKATSQKVAYGDMEPKIVFHDNGMGEFTYSNISLCEEAHNFDDKIAAIELTAKFEADESSSENAYTAISSIKRGDNNYTFFYANNKTANLAFKDGNGNFVTLYDIDGNVVSLSSATKLAVVYDDINGDVRYFINGKLAQYMSGEKLVYAEGVKVYNTDFVNAEGGNDALCFNPTKVSDVNISGLGVTDTAEIIGFQPNDFDNSIRLISGLDSLYYGSVGYEVRAYKADGTAYSTKSTVKSSSTVYSSVKADGVTLPATKYGYTYLSALSIDGDFLGYKDSYIIVKPFTKIGDKTYYGESVRLNILDNGKYEFAENN